MLRELKYLHFCGLMYGYLQLFVVAANDGDGQI